MIPTLQLGQIGRNIKRTGPTNAVYLDDFATLPRSCYGLRRLYRAYAGPAIRVRNRASGVETDIGFSGDALDLGALGTTYSGLDAVDVAKLYNQTGNASYDFIQATTNRQPELVQSGVYQGHLKFMGSDWMETSAALPFGTPYFASFWRHNVSTAATRVFLEMSTVSSSNAQAAMLYSAAANRMYMYSQNATSAAARQLWSDAFSGIAQRSYIFDRSISGAGEALARQGGSAQTQTAQGTQTDQTGNYSSYKLYLGARGDNTLHSIMDLDNLAIYDADTSALLSSIEAVIGVAP